jgi:hypothetical protein
VIPDIPKTLSFPPKPRKVEPQIATVDDPDDDTTQDSKTTTQEDPKQRHKHKPKQSGKTDAHGDASHD